MKLVKFKIKNFRGYSDEVSICFDNLTAFVGKNDVGKSTILEAMDIFFNSGKGVVKIDKDDINKTCSGKGNTEIVFSACFSELPDTVTIDETHSTKLAEEYLLNSEGNLEIVKKYKDAGAEKVFIKANHPTNSNCSDLLSKKNAELKKILDNKGITCGNRTTNSIMRKAIWTHYESDLQLTDIELDVSTKGEVDGIKSIWEKLQNFIPIYSLFQSDRKNSDTDDEVQNPLQTAVKQILSNGEVQTKLNEISIIVNMQKSRERRLVVHGIFYSVLGDIFAVGGNDFLIPVEGFFAGAFQCAVAFVVLVHIDETVAFFHFAGSGRDEVNGAPRAVTPEVYAIFINGFFHLLDVGAEVVDTGIVLNFTGLRYRFMKADAVFHNHHRQFIALLQDIEHIAQSLRVNGPAPVGFLDVGVLDAYGKATLQVFFAVFHRGGYMAHVVAEGEIIDLALFENIQIGFAHLDMIALVFPEFQDVGRIMAAGLNIAEEEALFHLFEGCNLVAGTAGFRIYRAHGQHAANLEVRINLVAFDNGFG